jgi:hypothetical protein
MGPCKGLWGCPNLGGLIAELLSELLWGETGRRDVLKARLSALPRLWSRLRGSKGCTALLELSKAVRAVLLFQ